jgi:hypothetical protein
LCRRKQISKYIKENPTKLSTVRTRRNCLQERTEPDEIKIAPDGIFFKREPDEILLKENPKNYLQGGPEELYSGRTRRIVLREDPKNCPQRGPEEIFLKEELDEILIKEEPKKKKRGPLTRSYCSEQEHR